MAHITGYVPFTDEMGDWLFSLSCHCYEKGKAYPSEQTIAILAGVSDKVVREGIKGLEEFPGFGWDYYLTKREKRGKKFSVNLPSTNYKGSAFPFYKFILEAGIWRKIRPSAKAIYPVMRYFGYFDIDEYAALEGPETEEGDYDEVYPVREFDYCVSERSVLVEHAGIHRNSLHTALQDLQANFLLESIDYSRWKVLLRSKDNTIWKRDYLNKAVRCSYRHISCCTKTTANCAQKLPKNAQIGSGS